MWSFFPFQYQIISCYVLQHWGNEKSAGTVDNFCKADWCMGFAEMWGGKKALGFIGFFVCFSCEESKTKSLAESWKKRVFDWEVQTDRLNLKLIADSSWNMVGVSQAQCCLWKCRAFSLWKKLLHSGAHVPALAEPVLPSQLLQLARQLLHQTSAAVQVTARQFQCTNITS